MDDLKTILARKPDWLSRVQSFVLRVVGPRLFPAKAEKESTEDYAIRKRKEEDLLAEMVTAENMKVWTKVFIHSSVDLEFNYESLEAIGDKLLGFIVLEYIKLKFRTEFGREINALEFASAGRNLVSNQYFEGLAGSINLKELLITFVDTTVKIRGDIFEALVGAIKEVGDRIGFRRGIPDLGYQIVRNFIISFYSSLRLVENYANIFPSDEKSIVQQIFRQLKWTTATGTLKPVHTSKTVEKTLSDGRIVHEVEFSVGVTGEASAWIAKYLKASIAPGAHIGIAQNRIKSQAEQEAYRQALQWLRRNHFTDERVNAFKNEMRLEELSEYLRTRASTKFPATLLETFKAKVAPFAPFEFNFDQQKDKKYGFLIGTNSTTKKKIYLVKIEMANDIRSGDDRIMTLMLMDKFVKQT